MQKNKNLQRMELCCPTMNDVWPKVEPATYANAATRRQTAAQNSTPSMSSLVRTPVALLAHHIDDVWLHSNNVESKDQKLALVKQQLDF